MSTYYGKCDKCGELNSLETYGSFNSDGSLEKVCFFCFNAATTVHEFRVSDPDDKYDFYGELGF